MLNSLQKEQARLRKQRQRDRQRDIASVDVTHNEIRDVTQYPPIIIVLADPIQRRKLQAIADSLENHNQLEGVRYGIGGPTFAQVSEMLDALH